MDSVFQMKKENNLLATLFALIAWTTMGGLIGFAVGYVVYVKQTAIFQSIATLNISNISGENPQRQVAEQSPTEIDLSAILASQEVISLAVKEGNLGRVFGITGKDANEIAQNLQINGNLEVIKGPTSDVGTAYELRFNGLTPSSSQIALDAICKAASAQLSEGGHAEQWQQAISLLTTTRREITEEIEELEQQLAEISPDVTSIKREGSTISPSMVRYRSLTESVSELESLSLGIKEKLRRVESLIQSGGSTESILISLDLPIEKKPVLITPPAISQSSSKQDETNQQIEIGKRLQAERDLRTRMEPLVVELNKLRERYGEKHPKVIFKKSEIEVFQKQIDALGPRPNAPTTQPEVPKTDPVESATESRGDLPENSNGTPKTENGVTKGPEESGETIVSDGQKVVTALNALKAEKDKIETELNSQRALLEELAATVSDEEIKAIEVDRLTDRLVIQNQLLQQTVSRLSKLPQHSPFSGRLISVINPPSPGSQVSPVLRPILRTSIGSGLLAGLGLFVLVYVASLVTTDPEVGQTESSLQPADSE